MKRPHTLPPNALYEAHLSPFLASHQETLQSQLDELQTSNKDLASQVVEQRSELAVLLQGLEALVGDLESASASMEQEGDGLVRDVRECEVLLAGK